MLTQTISEAFVQISARGLDAVRRQFGNLKQFAGQAKDQLATAARGVDAIGAAGRGIDAAKSQINNLGTFASNARKQLEATAKTVNVLGSAARQSFGTASNAMIRFAAAASPGDAMKLEAAYGRLTVQIGSLFLPVIRAATEYVNKITNALRQLTPEQREQIGTWAKWGLVILGVVGAGSTLLNFLPGLVGGIGAVGAAVKSMVSLLGIGGAALGGWAAVILAVVGALVGLGAVAVVAAGKTDSVTKVFRQAWEGIQKAATAAWSALKPLFATVGNIIAAVMQRVGTVIGRFADIATKVWETIGEIVQELTPVLQEVADAVMSLVDEVLDALAPVAEWFAETLQDGLRALLPTIKMVLGGMVQFIKDAIRELRILAKVMTEIANNPSAALDVEGTYKVARMQVDRDDRERAKKGADKDDGPAAKKASGPARQGVIDVYKPELSGIADVLRRAQTSALGESREQAMHRERIELQKQGIAKQAETTDAVRALNIGLT